jgi:hypothetical protein
MLTAAVLVIIGATGWALGRVRPQVNVAMAVMAVFGAITAHSGLQWAFIDGRMHDVLGDPRAGAPGVVVVPIAAVEALGLWLPILLIPWAQAAARVYGALYALAAATAAAVAFYFPDDLLSLDTGFIPADGAPYLLAALVCVPVAALGYAAGWMRARDDTDDEDRMIDRALQ